MKFLRAFLFFFCLPRFLLAIPLFDQNAHHSIENIPSWVKAIDFSTEAVPIKPSQVNLQCLLIDTQSNWEEKTVYQHLAVKALTKIGVQRISQLSVDFDPSYCQVIMHTARVFREGVWQDKLKNARHQLIQRESELEDNVYNGDLTLLYFLDDIREGDIIEYSYSLAGWHPLFASHYTEEMLMQREVLLEWKTSNMGVW